jgi:hypothetical protein
LRGQCTRLREAPKEIQPPLFRPTISNSTMKWNILPRKGPAKWSNTSHYICQCQIPSIPWESPKICNLPWQRNHKIFLWLMNFRTCYTATQKNRIKEAKNMEVDWVGMD